MIVIYYVNDYNEFMRQKKDMQSLVLLLVSLFGQMSIGILTLGLVFFMRDRFSLGAQLIGFFASAGTLMYFLGCVVLKHPVSLLRPPHAVGIATAGMMVSSGLIAVVPYVWMAFICYMSYGLFMSLFWPPLMGWLTRGLEGLALSKRLSWFNLSWSLGLGAAPYLSGVLTERQVSYPIYAASGIMGVISLVIVIAVFAVPSIQATVSNTDHIKRLGCEDHSTRLRFICWLGLFSGYVVFGVTMNVFPIYAREILLYPESTIGFFLLVRGLITAGTFVLLGRISWWQYNKVYMVILELFLAVICLLGIFAESSWLLMCFFVLFGIAFAAIYMNSIFHGAAGSPDRGSRMAVHEAVLTFGTILGSSLGGTLFQFGSFTAVMVFCMMVSLITILLQGVIWRIQASVSRTNSLET